MDSLIPATGLHNGVKAPIPVINTRLFGFKGKIVRDCTMDTSQQVPRAGHRAGGAPRDGRTGCK